MTLLIKKALVDGEETDIFIEGNRIKEISRNLTYDAEKVIDAKGHAAIPSFANSHTHAAMTLLRGYADDMPLQEWLEEKIWPIEAKLTSEQIYWGTRLACLEMIKTGTTFFNDMYWHSESVIKAVEDSGMRASISPVLMDFFDEKRLNDQLEHIEGLYKKFYSNKNIMFSLGPHSIYTLSEKGLRWASHFADKNNLLLHIHLSETKKEVEDCIKNNGMTPVEYLEKIGFLGENVIAAHCIWLNEDEISILRKRKTTLAYNPTSNMKLSSKGPFKYPQMKGMNITLGTDGPSSNNNLDMLEEMKFAALLQKEHHNPSIIAAKDAMEMTTINSSKFFSLNNGKIKEGKDADILLIDLSLPQLNPCYNLTSNMVYSANGSCVKTTICQGKVLMQDGCVEEEKEIIEKIDKISKIISSGNF